jgi:hypothetical protein
MIPLTWTTSPSCQIVPSTGTFKKIIYLDNFCSGDSFKISRVGKGESHPQTSHRTVREPLDSYGSS